MKPTQRISKIKPFINKYMWNGIKSSSKIDDWKTFEKNNPTLLLMFYILKKKIYNINIIKNVLIFQNSAHEKQIILIMIPNKKKRRLHYLALKKLSALLH